MAEFWRVVNGTTGETVVARLAIAGNFWSRLVGLQFRRALPVDAGLLLVPCKSVHTCFMRFPVDVVFLDRAGAVLAMRRNLRPWRAAVGPDKTYAVIELAAGSANLQPGEVLRLEGTSGGAAPFPVPSPSGRGLG